MKIELEDCDATDIDFAFEAKKQAMGPHIRQKWGWDEAFQLSLHHERWAEKPWFLIYQNDVKIGTVSIHELSDCTRFGEFYLLSAYQRKGIGTQVLRAFLENCDKNERRVKLEYLKWNPVGALYRRHGFQVVSENDIHYFMVRDPR